MKLKIDVLQKIVDGSHKATDAEIQAMARELHAIREDEAKRDDGTAAVKVEHAGHETMKGWFATQTRRLPVAQLHVGGRITMSGRTYSIISIEGEDDRTVRVR